MVLIPVILLTAFPPGVLFPDMAAREAQRFRRKGKGAPKTTEEGDATPQVVGAENQQREPATATATKPEMSSMA